jgi:hypothetical protein
MNRRQNIARVLGSWRLLLPPLLLVVIGMAFSGIGRGADDDDNQSLHPKTRAKAKADRPPPREENVQDDNGPAQGPPDRPEGRRPGRDFRRDDQRSPRDSEDGPPPPRPPRDRDGQGDENGPPMRPPFGPPPRGPQDGMRGGPDRSDPEFRKAMDAQRELDQKVGEAIRQYRQATGEARDKAKKEIEELVGKQFEARQAMRDLEIKRIEADLKRMRESQERRTKARDEIIKRRVADLLGSDEDVGF